MSDSPSDRASDGASESPTESARRRFPDVLEVVVEIPSGSRNKYEYDESAGVLRLDRVLSSAVFYNFEYGYVEGTRATTATTPTP